MPPRNVLSPWPPDAPQSGERERPLSPCPPPPALRRAKAKVFRVPSHGPRPTLSPHAIPYINGIKQFGVILVGKPNCLPDTLCPAKNLPRAAATKFLSLCARIEHGSPAELAAAKGGKTCCWNIARNARRCRPAIADGFGLSQFDHFGGRQQLQNKVLTQHFAAALYDQGLIEESRTAADLIPKQTGVSSLPTAMSKGHLPTAALKTARATKLVTTAPNSSNPEDLINPRSTVSVPPTSRCARPSIPVSCASRR